MKANKCEHLILFLYYIDLSYWGISNCCAILEKEAMMVIAPKSRQPAANMYGPLLSAKLPIEAFRLVKPLT
jgi:hypothetical protein